MIRKKLVLGAASVVVAATVFQLLADEVRPRSDPPKTSRVREDIEWSTTYSYGVHKPDLPRALVMGDSICQGYQGMLRSGLKDKVNITYWATSKCVTDRDYLRELDLILGANKYNFISFNNGLHSLEGTDLKEWEPAYVAAVKLIRQKCPGVPLYLVTCTPVADVGRNKVVQDLNKRILKIAEAEKLPVIDLYAATEKVDAKKRWRKDGVHFDWPAISKQAGTINIVVRKELKIQ